MINVADSIKERYRNGYPKNVRISFPNGEYPDIINDQIVAESLSFQESICSSKEFKLGLMEHPQISFDVVGIPDLTGKTIKAEIEVDATGTSYIDDKVYPMGDYVGFTVAGNATNNYRYQREQFITDNTLHNADFIFELKKTFVAPGIEYYVTGNVTVTNLITGQIVFGKSITDEKNDVHITDEQVRINITYDIFVKNNNSYAVNISDSFDANVYVKYDRYPDDVEYEADLGKYVHKVSLGFFIIDSCALVDSVIGKRKVNAFSDMYKIGNRSDIKLLADQSGETTVLYLNELTEALLNSRVGVYTQNTSYSTIESLEYYKMFGGLFFPNVQVVCDISRLSTGLNLSYWTISKPITREQIEAKIREFASQVSSYGRYELKESEIVHIINLIDNFRISNSDRNESIFYGYSSYVISSFNLRFQLRGELVIDTTVPMANSIKCFEKKINVNSPKVTVKSELLVDDDFAWNFIESVSELSGFICKKPRNERNRIYRVRLKTGTGLVPSEGLYPKNSLYPSSGNIEGTVISSELVSVDISNQIKPFGGIFVNYVLDDGTNNSYIHEIVEGASTVNYQIYDISNNWIIRNSTFESQEKVEEAITGLSSALADIIYIPTEFIAMNCPWIEAGDFVKVQINGNEYNTYVFEHSLNGIQLLKQDCSSK